MLYITTRNLAWEILSFHLMYNTLSKDLIKRYSPNTSLWTISTNHRPKVGAGKFFCLKEVVCWILGHFGIWRLSEKICVRFVNVLFKTTGIQRFCDPEMPSTVTGKYKFAVSWNFLTFFSIFRPKMRVQSRVFVERLLDQVEKVSSLSALVSCFFRFTFI